MTSGWDAGLRMGSHSLLLGCSLQEGEKERRSGNSIHKIEHISVNPSITNERRAFRAATTPCHLHEIAWTATWQSAFAPSEMHDATPPSMAARQSTATSRVSCSGVRYCVGSNKRRDLIHAVAPKTQRTKIFSTLFLLQASRSKTKKLA